ncbi:MAG: site-specific integrase [Lachnospiraceae bacterium]|nr:site-specific integrase [Lachnospiraceae bacterium]
MPKKRTDGRYQSFFTYEGKRYCVYGQNQKEILDKKLKKITLLQSGLLDHDNPTLNDYYDEFEHLNRQKVKPATIRSQRTWFNACAKVPILKNGTTLGDIRIRDITPKDCKNVKMALVESGKSSRTVNNYMDHLKHVFTVAVRDETIDKNPCLCIEPVRRTEPEASETIHRALTEEEVESFLDGAKNSFYLNHYRMLLQTGIRVGELGALQEKDIDQKQNVIHITTTVTRTDVGGYAIGDSAKTYAGKRDIPLTPEILETVDQQKKVNRALFGLRFKLQLFPSVEGTLLREYPINREIKRITKRKGIEHFTCHAFRATFSTRWMEQRPQDFKILSEILGHADTKITLDLYTHVMKDAKEEAMKEVKII